MKNHIHWIRSNGGPYILAGIKTASYWQGISGLSANDDQGSKSDYLRACTIKGYAGIIEGKAGGMLVINDLPNDLMIYKNTDSEAIIVKWVGADSDEQILKALNAEVDLNIGFEDQDVLLQVMEKELVIFDSANYLKDAQDNKLELKLNPGTYAIAVANYEPNDQLMLQIYQLRSAQ